eukprot:1184947-Amphidinium_carterae.4
MDSKVRKGKGQKKSQKAHHSRAKDKETKETERIRIRFSNGTTIRISRQAISQVRITLSISNPQAKAKIRKGPVTPVHSTKGKSKGKGKSSITCWT